jgi:hypothetical protein
MPDEVFEDVIGGLEAVEGDAGFGEADSGTGVERGGQITRVVEELLEGFQGGSVLVLFEVDSAFDVLTPAGFERCGRIRAGEELAGWIELLVLEVKLGEAEAEEGRGGMSLEGRENGEGFLVAAGGVESLRPADGRGLPKSGGAVVGDFLVEGRGVFPAAEGGERLGFPEALGVARGELETRKGADGVAGIEHGAGEILLGALAEGVVKGGTRGEEGVELDDGDLRQVGGEGLFGGVEGRRVLSVE